MMDLSQIDKRSEPSKMVQTVIPLEKGFCKKLTGHTMEICTIFLDFLIFLILLV